MRRLLDRLLAAAVAAGVAIALGAAAPARAADDVSVPTPSPSPLATLGQPVGGTPVPSASGATLAPPGPDAAERPPIGHLTDELVTLIVDRLRLTVALIVTASPVQAKPVPQTPKPAKQGPAQAGPSPSGSAAGLQPGGGSSTDARDWRPRAPIQVPTVVKVPTRAPRAAALTKEQLIWAAYASAAKAEATRCHISPVLLAAIGEVESSSLRGRSLNARHDAVPPVRGPALSGGDHAAIHDSDGGRLDGDPVWDHAVGPMQFIPGTWRIWGADGNGDGRENPQNIEDAALAAARYLCAGGRDLSRADDLRAAVLSYNHSQRYLTTVLGLVEAVTSGADAGP